MQKIVESPIKAWKRVEGKRYQTEEGYQINTENMLDLCKFAGVPGTLVNVDNKYGTTTALQIMEVASPNFTAKMVVDDETNKVLSILNPKSSYITDDQFDSIVEEFKKMDLGAKIKDHAVGAAKRVTFTLENTDEEKSKFLGDVFKKQIILERLRSGGMMATLGILRQVCTNGAVGTDKQFRKMFHQVNFGDEFIKTYCADILGFSLPDYLAALWTKEGQHIPASVADFLGMKDTLKRITDADTADLIFPTENIENHYNAQAIDIMTLPRQQLQKLPSGVSYYDAFNFLTNGIKANPDRTMEDDIKVADWARPSRLMQLKKSDISYKGIPYFSPEQIHLLAGDRA